MRASECKARLAKAKTNRAKIAAIKEESRKEREAKAKRREEIAARQDKEAKAEAEEKARRREESERIATKYREAAAAELAERNKRRALAEAEELARQKAEDGRIAKLKKRCGKRFEQRPQVGKSFRRWRSCWPYPDEIRQAGQQLLPSGKTANVFRVSHGRSFADIYVVENIIVRWVSP
jgi:hypothetical protein